MPPAGLAHPPTLGLEAPYPRALRRHAHDGRHGTYRPGRAPPHHRRPRRAPPHHRRPRRAVPSRCRRQVLILVEPALAALEQQAARALERARWPGLGTAATGTPFEPPRP